MINNNLPEKCFSTMSMSNQIVMLMNGIDGYIEVHDVVPKNMDEARDWVDKYNEILGVTRAQEEAMKFGSMFGFNTPGANPENYDENGNLKI